MAKTGKLGRDHAVVLGGSMAGLLAAKALSLHFRNVTVIERDRLPEGPLGRKGVPQGQHAHGLLLRGSMALEREFPGLREALAQAGGLVDGDAGQKGRWINGGRRAAPCTMGRSGFLASRPLVEHLVRRELSRASNVDIVSGCDALGLATTRTNDRVRGVRILRRVDGSAEEMMDADLVVDAMGRGSRAPEWLAALGYAAPPEETVRVGVTYTTRIFRRREADLEGDHFAVVAAVPPNLRSGVALAMEGDRWMVTLIGYLGERAPSELDGFVEYARTLPASDVYELLRTAEPIGEACTAKYPACRRRRYERLQRFPDAFLVMGDALCSFNPIYGQGISVAAAEAEALERAMHRPDARLWRRFFRAAAQIIDVPWMLAVGNDLRFEDVEGPRTIFSRWMNRYMERYHLAASRDPVLTLTFLRVVNLIERPSRLLALRTMARVWWGARRVSGMRALHAESSTASQIG